MIQKVNINNITGKKIKIIFLNNEKSNSSLLISDKITKIKPMKKNNKFMKKFWIFVTKKN